MKLRTALKIIELLPKDSVVTAEAALGCMLTKDVPEEKLSAYLSRLKKALTPMLTNYENAFVKHLDAAHKVEGTEKYKSLSPVKTPVTVTEFAEAYPEIALNAADLKAYFDRIAVAESEMLQVLVSVDAHMLNVGIYSASEQHKRREFLNTYIPADAAYNRMYIHTSVNRILADPRPLTAAVVEEYLDKELATMHFEGVLASGVTLRVSNFIEKEFEKLFMDFF